MEPLRLIAEWHTARKDGDYEYEFDDEGKQVYTSFANEMAQIMNEMWESGVGYQGNNVSKDKQTMIRYILYIIIICHSGKLSREKWSENVTVR